MLNSLENKHRKPRSPVTCHIGLSWCPHCLAWEAECEKHSYGLKALGSSLEKGHFLSLPLPLPRGVDCSFSWLCISCLVPTSYWLCYLTSKSILRCMCSWFQVFPSPNFSG